MQPMQSPRAHAAVRRQQAVTPAERGVAPSNRVERVRVAPMRAVPQRATPSAPPDRLIAPVTIAVISVSGAVNDADPAAGCSSCRLRTAFDNCADPVAAGLADTFGLIGHPDQGRGCSAYTAVNEQDGVAYWRLCLPDSFEDVAVCPPEPIESIRRRYPHAARIEPITYLDAWPAGNPS